MCNAHYYTEREKRCEYSVAKAACILQLSSFLYQRVTYHLAQHESTIHFIHRVNMCFVSLPEYTASISRHSTDQLFFVMDAWLAILGATNCILYRLNSYFIRQERHALVYDKTIYVSMIHVCVATSMHLVRQACDTALASRSHGNQIASRAVSDI